MVVSRVLSPHGFELNYIILSLIGGLRSITFSLFSSSIWPDRKLTRNKENIRQGLPQPRLLSHVIGCHLRFSMDRYIDPAFGKKALPITEQSLDGIEAARMLNAGTGSSDLDPLLTWENGPAINRLTVYPIHSKTSTN
jgi:hypothetical protein